MAIMVDNNVLWKSDFGTVGKWMAHFLIMRLTSAGCIMKGDSGFQPLWVSGKAKEIKIIHQKKMSMKALMLASLKLVPWNILLLYLP